MRWQEPRAVGAAADRFPRAQLHERRGDGRARRADHVARAGGGRAAAARRIPARAGSPAGRRCVGPDRRPPTAGRHFTSMKSSSLTSRITDGASACASRNVRSSAGAALTSASPPTARSTASPSLPRSQRQEAKGYDMHDLSRTPGGLAVLEGQPTLPDVPGPAVNALQQPESGHRGRAPSSPRRRLQVAVCAVYATGMPLVSRAWH